MDKTVAYGIIGLVVVVVVIFGAGIMMGGGGGQPTPTPEPSATPTAEPETPTPAPTPTAALANPAAKYCADLGYELDGETCLFPPPNCPAGQNCVGMNRSSCEIWAFYYGECGRFFSYCELHGGRLQTRTENMSTWTAKYAVCTFNDSSECLEQAYANGSCAKGQCRQWNESVGGCVLMRPELANPAATYCAGLGYRLEGENCLFTGANQPRCTQWAFYRGECGKQFSFCERHGGSLQARTENVGGATFKYAVCAFRDGSECLEQKYYDGLCSLGQCMNWLESRGGCVEGTGTNAEACAASGGNVTATTCCISSGSFPNTCLIGACGCSPENSHDVQGCDCGAGKCWDGTACVALGG